MKIIIKKFGATTAYGTGLDEVLFNTTYYMGVTVANSQEINRRLIKTKNVILD